MARVTTKMHVEGLRELQEALRELPKATARNVLRRALTEAAQPMAAAAEAKAPVAKGSLKRSHTVGTKLSRRQKGVHRQWAGTVPVRTPRGWRSAPAKAVYVFAGPGPLPQATQQEFGNANHPPQPFMRPAWDAHKEQAARTIKERMAAQLEAARKRIARKAERIARKVKQRR